MSATSPEFSVDLKTPYTNPELAAAYRRGVLDTVDRLIKIGYLEASK